MTDDDTLARLLKSFPSRLGPDVAQVYESLGSPSLLPTAYDIGPVTVEGEVLCIPRRVFFDQPAGDVLERLTDTQTLVLSALMTRHHDGFARERWVTRIADCQGDWLAPFVIQLLGERVVEIAERIDALGVSGLPCYREVARTNPPLCRLTCARILTVWDLLYRTEFPRFSDYPPYRVAREMGVWTRGLRRRLRR